MTKLIGSDHRNFRTAMTVAELIEALQDCDPDAIPLFTVDYGDYHHTQQALPVKECEGLTYGQFVVESAYSQSGMALVEDEDDDAAGNHDAQEQQFVILK